MAKRKNDNLLELVPRKGKTVRIDESSFRAEPPAWFGMTFLGFGIAASYMLLRGLPYVLGKHDVAGILTLLVLVLLFGGGFTAAGVLLLYLRVDIPRSLPIEDVSRRLGLSEAEIKQVADEQGILPRYHITGRDFFRLDDFDVTSLLRASSAPVSTETLLRAATSSPTSSDLLVRGSSASPVRCQEGGETLITPEEKTPLSADLHTGGC